MPVQTILPGELKEKLKAAERFVLVDVREDYERNYCVIGTAECVLDLHIPLSNIPLRMAEFSSQGLPIVVYCHHGVRSMVAAQWLAARGVERLLNLEGGIDA